MNYDQHGYTKVPHYILEKLFEMNISGLQLRVLLVLLRYTLGFNRNSYRFSLGFLARVLNTKPPRISEALKVIIDKKLVNVVEERKGSRARMLELNQSIFFGNDESEADQHTGTTMFDIGGCFNSEIDNSSIPLARAHKRKKKIIKEIEVGTNSLPEELCEVDGFKEAFQEWSEHRKAMKKPLTPQAMNQQLKKLIILKADGQNIIDVINKAIESGWQSFYPIVSNEKSFQKQNTEFNYQSLI
ncbi:MAG: replication protein [Bacteroidetes bacterium]|nr:replication protein [Bacteroidota bacterium]